MKYARNLALMALGAGAVLAYQKYSRPVMNSVNGVKHQVNKAVAKANNKLEDMM